MLDALTCPLKFLNYSNFYQLNILLILFLCVRWGTSTLWYELASNMNSLVDLAAKTFHRGGVYC